MDGEEGKREKEKRNRRTARHHGGEGVGEGKAEERTVGKPRDIYLRVVRPVSRPCRPVQFTTITKHNATKRPRSRSPFRRILASSITVRAL